MLRDRGGAPVWTLDVGHSSSGTRVSRTNAARPAQVGGAVGLDGDVVDDPDAVAKALGPADLQRLPDGRQPERLAGVDRDVEVLAADVLERVEVPRGPVAGLGPGDVEADDAVVAVPDRQLRDLHRVGGLAHRGEQRPDDDRAAGPRRALHPARGTPRARRSTTSSGVMPFAVDSSGAKRTSAYTTPSAARSSAHSAATRAIAPGCCITPHGVRERLEVELQALAVGATAEPGGELVHVLGGQVAVAVLAGKVDDGRRAQPAVQVVVEQGLGRAADGVEREHVGPPGAFSRIVALRGTTGERRRLPGRGMSVE